MFFDRFQSLCEKRNISVYKACKDIGLNRSAVNKWKAGGQPNGSTVAKFAEYFGVTADFLLSDGPETLRSVSPAELKFALFGGDGDITDEMYDEVLKFAAYVKQREAEKKE